MKKLTITLLLFCFGFIAQAQTASIKYQQIGTMKIDTGFREVYYKIISGNTGNYFIVTPCSAVIAVNAAVYKVFAKQKTYSLVFTVTDAEGKYVKVSLNITLSKDTKGNQLPAKLVRTPIPKPAVK